MDVGGHPLGAWLELSFFKLASPNLDFSHDGCAIVWKKSCGASLHQRFLAHPGSCVAVSADGTGHWARASERCRGGALCGRTFECRSGRVDLRTEVGAVRPAFSAGHRSLRLVR